MQIRVFATHLKKNTPIHLLTVTTVCVFAAEALIMIFLSLLPDLGKWATVFVDATLIVLLVLPVLYVFFYKSLQRSVTERAQSVKLLQTSERKFRSYVDSSPYAIIVVDKEGSIIDVNDATARVSGYSLEGLLTMNLGDFFAPEDREMGITHFSRVVTRGTSSGIVPIVVKSGARKHWEVEAVKLDENRFLGFISDVTARIETEEALHENASKLIEAQRIAQLGYYNLDIRKDSWTCSAELNEVFGLDKNHKNDMAAWLQIVHPEDREMMMNYFQSVVLSQHRKFDKEYRIIDAIAGQQKWVHGLGDLKLDENNNPVEMFGTIQDITERKLEQEKLRLLLDNLPCIALILEKGSRKIVASNNAGHEAGAIPGQTCYGTCAKRQENCTFCRAPEMWETKETQEIEVEYKNVWYRGVWMPLTDDLYVHYIFDITETKRLQELESRAARLEMAGTIAGQVAHDFNNLLAPIMAYPELIRDDLKHDHKSRAYLDDIESAAKKIADINQDLLTMGRRGHYSQDVIDLNKIVLHAIKELNLRTKTVTVEVNLCQDLMKMKGGVAQIYRMLTNLFVNAQDAMDDIGQLTIKTENYYVDDTSITFGCVPKGEYIKLTITDNGSGIPDNIMKKILDPFFSTKTADKKRGSGLGLSVVDAVIKDHNGYLDLSSKVGQGTSFYLYFPITRENCEKDKSEDVAGGTEKILVVDDDDIQREVTSKLLKKLGYEISSVTSGAEAIAFLHKTPQDLVILDMVMPGGIDGAETYRQIRELNPYQKAIILSGFSETDRISEAQKLGAGAFIRKPVTKNSIAAAVRTELDRKTKAVTF